MAVHIILPRKSSDLLVIKFITNGVITRTERFKVPFNKIAKLIRHHVHINTPIKLSNTTYTMMLKTTLKKYHYKFI